MLLSLTHHLGILKKLRYLLLDRLMLKLLLMLFSLSKAVMFLSIMVNGVMIDTPFYSNQDPIKTSMLKLDIIPLFMV
jgi:hypothetical protein